MDTGYVRKRKRPVTSCGECYRRKQKCNRELPCAICVIRGVPEKCSFDGQFEEFSHPTKRLVEDTSKSITNNDVSSLDDSIVVPSDLSEQTGYSHANGNNLDILQALLNREEHTEVIINDGSGQKLPDFVLYQIAEIEKKLPSTPIQMMLIDLYFDQCWWWYSSLEPALIKRMFKEWQNIRSTPKRDHSKYYQYFPALLFQVLAIGLQYIHPGAVDVRTKLNLIDTKSADALSAQFSKAGMQIMDLLGRHDSAVTAVQHDMLRGVWLKNLSRGTESWYCLGNAIRQAQELELHHKQEPPSSLQGEALNNWLWHNMLRQRVWACLFSWDAHVAFTLGRPRVINAKDCAKMDLLECTLPEDTFSRPPARSDKSEPSFVTPVLFHYSLAYLIHEMLDAGAARPTLNDYSVLERLHDKVRALQGELPRCFSINNPDYSWDSHSYGVPSMRLNMASLANTYLVALHRAHVLRRPQSYKAAVSAAVTTLEVQQQLFEITDRQKWRIYTYSFYTIDSSIFLAALLLEQPRTSDRVEHDKTMEQLTKSLRRLELMQEVSPMAATGAKIMNKCLGLIVQRRKRSSAGSYVTVTDGLPSVSSGSSNITEESSVSNDDVPYTYLDPHASPSLRAWIEQMDQVMLPIMQGNSDGPFDNSLWDILLEG